MEPALHALHALHALLCYLPYEHRDTQVLFHTLRCLAGVESEDLLPIGPLLADMVPRLGTLAMSEN